MASSVCYCVCCIHLTSSCTPCLECVYAFVQVYMSTWFPMSTQSGVHSVHGKMGPHVWQYFCVPFTSFLFLQLVYYVYMHQFMYLCPSDSPCQMHPLCIVYICSSVWHCVYCSQIISVPAALFGMFTCISSCIYANVSSQLFCITYA